jgi:hypothetical protein
MTRPFLRACAVVLAIAKFSMCAAQDFAPTAVYEALFAQAEPLGSGRTYYVREREARSFLCSDGDFADWVFEDEEARSRSCDDAEFEFPDEIASHRAEEFGNISVVIVDEAYLSTLWDDRCIEGWEDFHRAYPDAGDLIQVSQVVFNDLGNRAAVFVEIGSGCLFASFATYFLENQDGRWVITRIRFEGEA